MGAVKRLWQTGDYDPSTTEIKAYRKQKRGGNNNYEGGKFKRNRWYLYYIIKGITYRQRITIKLSTKSISYSKRHPTEQAPRQGRAACYISNEKPPPPTCTLLLIFKPWRR
jgi:hypothetical protein